MNKISDLEYLKLNKLEKLIYKLKLFFLSIPEKLLNLCKKIGKSFVKFFTKIGNIFTDLVQTFKNGDWKTKVSYGIMGFGNLTRGQIFRGLLFLLFEIVFILYMAFVGVKWLGQLGSLGDVAKIQYMDKVEIAGVIIETPITIYVDNSFKILLYNVLTIFFIIGFIFTWYTNIKQNKIAESIIASGKKLKSAKDDLHSLLDDQFHKTLLALPLLGIIVFTVVPIIFMILVAFTNFDGSTHNPPNNLFDWVGFDNFAQLLTWSNGSASFAATFGEVLTWTLIWAFFATFSNYFLGMLVAMLINKKGIKLKKLWRTILVMTIAVPQFISLLYVSKMFAQDGIINGLLLSWGVIDTPIGFFMKPDIARITVIIINIWIGIPHLMLIATGVLMNIPQDLYESAKIDGANSFQMYAKITLPYMLFVTGPYLLTSFIGNMNNFNVIYLLTGGGPDLLANNAGKTDLLITWLYSITMEGDQKYYLASVIGIMVFVVVAVISLVVYNAMPSIKNEEDFQ